MAQYIDKSALVAEIDRQKIGYNVDGKHSVEYDITRKIIDIINNLEVKEVDLETELGVIIDSLNDDKYEHLSIHQQLSHIARHFFELGLKEQKGE